MIKIAEYTVTLNPQGVVPSVYSGNTANGSVPYSYWFFIKYYAPITLLHTGTDSFFNFPDNSDWIFVSRPLYWRWYVLNANLPVKNAFTTLFGSRTMPDDIFMPRGNNPTISIYEDAPIFILYGRMILWCWEMFAVNATESPVIIALEAAGDTDASGVDQKIITYYVQTPAIAMFKGLYVIDNVYQDMLDTDNDNLVVVPEAIPIEYQLPYSTAQVDWSLTGELASYFEIIADPMAGTDVWYTSASLGRWSSDRAATIRLKCVNKIPRTVTTITGYITGTRKTEFDTTAILINPVTAKYTLNCIPPPPVKPYFCLADGNTITNAFSAVIYDSAITGTNLVRLYTLCDDDVTVELYNPGVDVENRFEIYENDQRFWIRYTGVAPLVAGSDWTFDVIVTNDRNETLLSYAIVTLTVEAAPMIPVLEDRTYQIPVTISTATGLTYSYESSDPVTIAIANLDGTSPNYMKGTIDYVAKTITWFRNPAATITAGIARVMYALASNNRDVTLTDSANISFYFFALPSFDSEVFVEETSVYDNIQANYEVVRHEWFSDETLTLGATYQRFNVSTGETAVDQNCPFWLVVGTKYDFTIQYNASRALTPGDIYTVTVIATVVGDIPGSRSYQIAIAVEPTPQQPVFSNIAATIRILDNLNTDTVIGDFNVLCDDEYSIGPSVFCEADTAAKFVPTISVTDGTLVNVVYQHNADNPLDSETQSFYYLRLVATNLRDNTQFTYATVTIEVLPYVEPPVVSDKTFTVREDADAGTIIGNLGAAISDPGGMAYVISGGNAAGLWSVDASGNVILELGGILDYATGTKTYQLLIRVYAAANNITYVSMTATIQVLPSNSLEPTISTPIGDMQVMLPVRKYDPVGRVDAVSNDNGGIVFSISASTLYAIHPATGVVYVLDPDTLNAAADTEDYGNTSTLAETLTVTAASYLDSGVAATASFAVYPFGYSLVPALSRDRGVIFDATNTTIRFCVDAKSLYQEAVIGYVYADPTLDVWFTFSDASHILDSGFGITNGGAIYVDSPETIIANCGVDTQGTNFTLNVLVYLRDNSGVSTSVTVIVNVLTSLNFRHYTINNESARITFVRDTDHGYRTIQSAVSEFFVRRNSKTYPLYSGSEATPNGLMTPCLPELLPAGLLELPGTWNPESPEYCNYEDETGSRMVYIPKMGCDITPSSLTWNSEASRIEPCFFSENQLYPGIFIDKYPASYELINAVPVLVSKPGKYPISMDAALFSGISNYHDFSIFADGWNHVYSAYSLARLRGTDNFLLPYSVKVMLDRWQLTRYYNNLMLPGSPHMFHHNITSNIANYGDEFLGDHQRYLNIPYGISLTGGGGPSPGSCAHNGMPSGVMDFYSGHWELLGGHYLTGSILKLPTAGVGADLTASPFTMSSDAIGVVNTYTTNLDLSGMIGTASEETSWMKNYPMLSYMFEEADGYLLEWWANNEILQYSGMNSIVYNTVKPHYRMWHDYMKAGIIGTNGYIGGLRTFLHSGMFSMVCCPTPMRFIDIRDQNDMIPMPATFRTCRYPLPL